MVLIKIRNTSIINKADPEKAPAKELFSDVEIKKIESHPILPVKTEDTGVFQLELIKKELSQSRGASVINLLNLLVEYGHKMRASDIHLDPDGSAIKFRFRVDGVLLDVCDAPKSLHDELVSRVKILAGLRTDEHQAAQDGRFKLALKDDCSVDVRVSIVPTYYGENTVLRLLSDKAEEFSLEALGFIGENRTKLEQAIQKPFGMILATGPTGSGKTTTLYTLVKMLNKRDISIVTLEDPIEYSIGGINQIQVNPRTGLNFANGLRSILRQDPNIIMVGEIRDAETAGIAVNTALTGHLVLSTLHTNDSATTLPRLLDMKVESYLIASTVNVAIGQRLVRRICPSCKIQKEVTHAETGSLNGIISKKLLSEYSVFYYGAGCEACGQTGYKGRVGIHEVLVTNAKIKEAILNKLSAAEIRKIAIAEGMVPMVEDGFIKAAHGVTTISEILRVLHE